LDASSDRFTATIPVEGAQELAAGVGSLWVATSGGEIVRISPRGVVQAVILTEGVPKSIAVGAGGIWVAEQVGSDESSTGEIMEIDPSTQAVVRAIPIGDNVLRLVATGDSVWVDGFNLGSVVRIDPEQGGLTEPAVRADRMSFAVGAGSVWVTDQTDGSVTRIDAVTHRVVHRWVVLPGGGVASGPSLYSIVGRGAVWTFQESQAEYRGRAWRIDPITGRIVYLGRRERSPFAFAFGSFWFLIKRALVRSPTV